VQPVTRYARNGTSTLAWTEIGDGPVDLLFSPGFISHVEHFFEDPALRRFLERLGSFSRVILMDRRGTGMSDPISDGFGMQDELDDITAVLDAAQSDRPVLLGYTSGGPIVAMFAARYPERVRALIMYAAIARFVAGDGYGFAHTPEERAERFREMIERWGTGANLENLAPSAAEDAQLRSWLARLERLSSSPGQMERLQRYTESIDVRDSLPTIRVPTLILHRMGDRLIDVGHSRYLAAHIAGARYVELDGIDNLPSVGDTDAITGEIEEFLTGGRSSEPKRALLTVLLTDIVDATSRAAALGDARWRDLLSSHDQAVRREVDRFGGREVKTIGDAFLVTFDGAPSQALRCAKAIIAAVQGLGLEIRAGLHTGECELIGEDVGGMAVHIAARVSDLARSGEVLVSGTVTGTVVGAGFSFEERGVQDLRGVPGHWPIFAVA
jgi:class 3 adenylate cyclase